MNKRNLIVSIALLLACSAVWTTILVLRINEPSMEQEARALPSLAPGEYPYNFVGPLPEGSSTNDQVITYNGTLYWRFVDEGQMGPLVPGQEWRKD